MLQNLLQLWNTKNYRDFYYFHSVQLFFLLYLNDLSYVNRDREKASSTKLKMNKPHGFSYSKNMANFEAFY